MNCENEFCIYQKEHKCLFETVDHDINGHCECCIYPDIPPKTLEREKKKLRDKFKELDGE